LKELKTKYWKSLSEIKNMKIKEITQLKETKIRDVFQETEYKFPYKIQKIQGNYYIVNKNTNKIEFNEPIKSKDELKKVVKKFLLDNKWFRKFKQTPREKIINRYVNKLKEYFK
jgi:hypothetical protein